MYFFLSIFVEAYIIIYQMNLIVFSVYVKPVKHNGRVLEQELHFENIELDSNGRYTCHGHFNATYVSIQRAFSLKVIGIVILI